MAVGEGGGFGPICGGCLVEDVPQMKVYGVQTYEQALGNLLVGPASGHMPENVCLTLRQACRIFCGCLPSSPVRPAHLGLHAETLGKEPRDRLHCVPITPDIHARFAGHLHQSRVRHPLADQCFHILDAYQLIICRV